MWDLEKQRGRGFKVIIRREGEKPQTIGTFIGCHKKNYPGSWPLNCSVLNYWSISVSCGVKSYMHYIRFLLTKTSYIRKAWINFYSWNFHLHYWFFINLWMTTEWAFAFLSTAIIIFCLMYSLNIPHSNQNPSFFFFFFAVPIVSKFRIRWFSTTSYWLFLFVWFYHCHGRRNYILKSFFIVSRPSS